MTDHQKQYNRLPISFHQTFIPERQYITELLYFIGGGGTGTDQEISKLTGIPVGQSSGKVPAIISYCNGMGLIIIKKAAKDRQREFELTPFGRAVLLEDKNLSEELTQWLVHLHLCRRHGGAEIWHLCFGKSMDILGMNFTEKSLNEYLERICGNRSRCLIGPLINTYEEPASLKNAKAISRSNGGLTRTAAPLLTGFRFGYSAFLLDLWGSHFPEDRQVTLTDFEAETYWTNIGAWDDRQKENVLDMIQTTGAIKIDKLMRPWVLIRCGTSNQFWSLLYEDLA